jgi:hypothetical protein
MKLTPRILYLLWARSAHLDTFAEDARPVLQKRPVCAATGALWEAAERVVRKANAWGRTTQAASDRVPDVVDGALTLQDMELYPYQYTVSQLLAERETLGATESWCRWRGMADAAEQVAA